MTERRTVVFLHIPKAAGSTLHAILNRQYRNQRIYDVRGADTAPLVALPERLRREIGLVKGHMAFGIHRHLPNACTYVTMLRHPVERAISHYYYVLRQPNHYLHRCVADGGIGLRDYVCSGVTHEMDNGQVRLLSGHDDDLPPGACSQAHLDRAKRNLERFAVVGLAEHFDASILMMQRALAWESMPYYAKRNVRSGRRPYVDFATRECIARANALDMELYEYARARFADTLSAMPELRRDHERFRRRLVFVGPCLSVAHRTGSRLRARRKAVE